MIAIIDYGLGNLASVANALKKLEIPYVISSDPEALKNSTALLLPGVGAAGQGIKNLKKLKLDNVIVEEVKKGKPLLGICLGMQLLFEKSEEGNTECLGLIKGKVRKFKIRLKIPQIGWNQVENSEKSKLLKDIKNKDYFYFVNSYYCDPDNKKYIVGTTQYENEFCSVIEYKNIFGTQFHPEKSGESGLKLLKNFWEVACK
ncbi:MAG TPA: imidazole glycerol phosphate synthase subunit HisH [Candidatus Saccharimonadales bacterium]|nr:imidazole glycerol phosphate synthase subunit HisH [Candidatus Saccharimonadales bacterium]